MNRAEYLRTLSAALSDRVGDSEREDILRYYEEYFDEAGPEGEADLIAELGDPSKLAARLAEEGGFAPKGGPRTPESGMGRGRKTGLIAAACVVGALLLLLAGGIIGVIRWAMIPPQPPQSTNTMDTAPMTQPPQSTDTVEPTPPEQTEAPIWESFSAIRLDIAVGDVELRTGDGYDVELEWNQKKEYSMTAVVERGILQVSSSPAVESTDKEDYDARVTITVPEGISLGKVELAAGVGKITAARVTADELELTAGVGAVRAEDCTAARSIDLESGTGAVSAENCTAEDSLSLESGTGAVSAESCTAQRSLSLETGVGAVELVGPLARETKVESHVGKVTVRTSTPEADCAYDIECGMGTLTVDGREYLQKAEKAQGSFTLDCSSDVGKVSVKFGA